MNTVVVAVTYQLQVFLTLVRKERLILVLLAVVPLVAREAPLGLQLKSLLLRKRAVLIAVYLAALRPCLLDGLRDLLDVPVLLKELFLLLNVDLGDLLLKI